MMVCMMKTKAKGAPTGCSTQIEELIRIYGFHTVTKLANHIPLRILYYLADMLGGIAASDKRPIIVEDLKTLLGCSQKRAAGILGDAMRLFRKDIFELWKIPSLNARMVERMTSLNGLEHLENGLRAGRGVVIPVVHFGSWKIILAALGYRGYKVNQIAGKPMTFVKEEERSSHNLILEYEYRCEQKLPVRFIYVEDTVTYRKLFEVLRQNEIVVAALDGILGGGKRLWVDFFNGRINLSIGPISLAHRTGAALVPLFPVRQHNDRHRLEFSPPLTLQELDDDFVSVWLRAYASLFSARVRERPEHYARWLFNVRKYPLPESGYIIDYVGSGGRR